MKILRNVLLILIVAFAVLPPVAQAASLCPDIPNTYEFQDPLEGACVPDLVKRIVTAILSVSGALFFTMFLWGGVTWMTAGGDSTRVKKARTTLMNAVIGLMIIALSYAIVNAVITALAGQNPSPPGTEQSPKADELPTTPAPVNDGPAGGMPLEG